MLRRPLYLDTEALDEYIASIEGGLRGGGSTTQRSGKGGGGSLGAGPAKISAEGNKGSEESQEYADHHASRLDRLLKACESDPESLGYVDVTQPDDEFPAVGFGALCAWECDIYVPESVAALSQAGEVLSMMGSLGPLAAMFGEDADDLPDKGQLDAMSSFLKSADLSPVIVGEDDDSDWRIVGELQTACIRPGTQLEGRVRVVGKVAKKIAENRWHPLVDFPGSGLVSREERRRIAREGPAASEQDNYLRGPAVVLDILTIFR